MSENECLPWCGDFDVPPQARGMCIFIKGSVFTLKNKEAGNERSFCCHEKALVAAGLGMERFEQPKGFYSEGIAPQLAKAQQDANMKADAERLAELREELELWADKEREFTAKSVSVASIQREMQRLETLIAVYEECAARGLTFGGGR